MSRRLLFRPAAEADLDALDDYIAQDSPGRAFAFLQRIRETCETLCQFSESGRARDDISPGLRTLAFERRVVIAYRASAEAVEIVRVFYAGRDMATLLIDEPDPD
jgi:toxin ParE1/3/4